MKLIPMAIIGLMIGANAFAQDLKFSDKIETENDVVFVKPAINGDLLSIRSDLEGLCKKLGFLKSGQMIEKQFNSDLSNKKLNYSWQISKPHYVTYSSQDSGIEEFSCLKIKKDIKPIGKIEEKRSNRSIVISSEESESGRSFITYNLVSGSQSKELSRIEINATKDKAELIGRNSTYRFQLLKKGIKIKNQWYEMCWDRGAWDSVGTYTTGSLVYIAPLAIVAPGAALIIGGSAVSFCTALPMTPAILGLALLPVDAAITGVVSLTNSEAIAYRKLKKALEGKVKRASPKVFNKIIKRIENL